MKKKPYFVEDHLGFPIYTKFSKGPFKEVISFKFPFQRLISYREKTCINFLIRSYVKLNKPCSGGYIGFQISTNNIAFIEGYIGKILFKWLSGLRALYFKYIFSIFSNVKLHSAVVAILDFLSTKLPTLQ